jgi:hypothetical protein
MLDAHTIRAAEGAGYTESCSRFSSRSELSAGQSRKSVSTAGINAFEPD